MSKEINNYLFLVLKLDAFELYDALGNDAILRSQLLSKFGSRKMPEGVKAKWTSKI